MNCMSVCIADEDHQVNCFVTVADPQLGLTAVTTMIPDSQLLESGSSLLLKCKWDIRERGSRILTITARKALSRKSDDSGRKDKRRQEKQRLSSRGQREACLSRLPSETGLDRSEVGCG